MFTILILQSIFKEIASYNVNFFNNSLYIQLPYYTYTLRVF